MECCSECGQILNYQVISFSSQNFGLPLCVFHQKWVDEMGDCTTQETIKLYFSLKQRGAPAILEHFDGYKHVDIAIPDARVNKEVDGGHHNYNTMQALADLKRTYFSFLNEIYTIRIPNSLVYNDYILEETADFIISFLNESVKKNYRRQ